MPFHIARSRAAPCAERSKLDCHPLERQELQNYSERRRVFLCFEEAHNSLKSPRERFFGRLLSQDFSALAHKLLVTRKRTENFNHAVFTLAFFSRRQDRELLGAISRGLLDCPCRV